MSNGQFDMYDSPLLAHPFRPPVAVMNGILTDASSFEGWVDYGVDHINRAGGIALPFEYSERPSFFRRRRNRSHAEQFARRLMGYPGDRCAFLHSNANEIGCMAVDEFGLVLKRLVMIAPAAEADFNVNGLNSALVEGRVGEIVIMTGGRDEAALPAAMSSWLFSWFGAGFGTMLKTGPLNVAGKMMGSRVIPIHENTYRHSTWLTPTELPITLRRGLDGVRGLKL